MHCRFRKIGIGSAYECIAKNIEEFTKEKTAIFTYSDIVGLGVVQALRNLNIKIPEQVQVLGMDDVPLSSVLIPKMSTVHVEVDTMVSKACGLLLKLISGETISAHEWIKPHLEIRDTTI